VTYSKGCNISGGDLLSSSPTSLESFEKVKEEIGASSSDKVKLHGGFSLNNIYCSKSAHIRVTVRLKMLL
jgi:hypothetical protein